MRVQGTLVNLLRGIPKPSVPWESSFSGQGLLLRLTAYGNRAGILQVLLKIKAGVPYECQQHGRDFKCGRRAVGA